VKTIMKDAGTALMGIGIGTGENRAEIAAKAAISSPLLEQSVEDAKGILFNVIGGSDLTMKEVDKAANIIRNIANDEANIIFGTTIDQRLAGQVKITVIATGFDVKQEDLGYGFVEKTYAKPELKKEPTPIDEKKPPFSEKPKDVFKPEDFEGDFENKYDIPAFLRGK